MEAITYFALTGGLIISSLWFEMSCTRNVPTVQAITIRISMNALHVSGIIYVQSVFFSNSLVIRTCKIISKSFLVDSPKLDSHVLDLTQ